MNGIKLFATFRPQNRNFIDRDASAAAPEKFQPIVLQNPARVHWQIKEI